MRFWDTSAIVPTLLDEHSSSTLRRLLEADPSIAAWWSTVVECASAIARRERTGALEPRSSTESLVALRALAAAWIEIPPSDVVRDHAVRLVRTHDLRAADALQLAAARVVSGERAESLPFVTLDERLAIAAAREGFPVLP